MGYVASSDEIRSGKTTDIYFRRTLKVLEKKGLDRVAVKGELFLKKLPDGYGWGIFAGLSDVLNLLEGREVDVKSLPEGSLFLPGEPVMNIAGPYGEFAELETALLGFLCQASGIATKSARIKRSAKGKTVLSFGARRMHPALAPFIDRNAYVGGIDGVSVILSAEKLGLNPSGTVPHALILVLGDTLDAMKAFDEVVPEYVKRICLIDTFQDEKFEAVRVADAMGEKLFAVRLDTPASRRGDFGKIIEEVRWELDLRGHQAVKIIVSGGLSEDDICDLADRVDGFGVGTCISNSPVLDFSLDLVEVDGVNRAKRGKMSGGKELLTCESCHERIVVPEGRERACSCGGRMVSLFFSLLEEGRSVKAREDVAAVRERAAEEFIKFGRYL